LPFSGTTAFTSTLSELPQHLHSSTPTHIQQQLVQPSEMFFIFCKKFSISTTNYAIIPINYAIEVNYVNKKRSLQKMA
jgi:hypothetical protein